MNTILFQTTDWATVPSTEHPGETGTSYWKTLQYGDLRIRRVEYSKNYKADHWCSLGHIVFCIEGELVSELSDGRQFSLSAGMSYQVSNGASCHRSVSKEGASLLIIDGDFLKNNREVVFNPWKM
ncbi:MAG: DHCW motif cupin fold protein [Bacteroidota bacterium]